jgi:homopolymeric O-antigen transport system permease protein
MVADDPGSEGVARSAEVWRIEPAPPNIWGQVSAFWRYRHLYPALAVRALFNVYRNAMLGIAWVAAQPLAVAVPAVFIVGGVFGVSVAPLPLPLFVLSGLALWTLFRASVQWMTKSINSGRVIFERVYVPALLLLVAAMTPGLFQFAVVFVLVVAAAIYYGPIAGIYSVPVGWHLLGLVPAMLMAVFLAIGLSCFTAILNAFARDTWLTLRYVLSAWLLATPIVYPVDVIPEAYRWIIYLNPLTPTVELFRWALLGFGTVHWPFVALACVEILVVVLGGIWFFAKQQNRLFDHA